ncbi:MAG: hypothetical protein H0X45_02125, partial [Planctomycetes bacterium]|nr:hypothetical protein [Planctomycetota bacterium]
MTMVDRINLMRNSVSIPPGCRERYALPDRPGLRHWQRAGLTNCGVSNLVAGYR